MMPHLTKKTVSRFYSLRARLWWYARPSAFTGGGVTVAQAADKSEPHAPHDAQLGALPSITIDLGTDGKVELSAVEVQQIVDAVRAGQKATFVGRMADLNVREKRGQ